MADHGEVALRMLEPHWTTVQGTVRQWTEHPGQPAFDRRMGRMTQGGWGHGMPAMVSVSSIRVGDDGSTPGGSDHWERLWLRRSDDSHRIEYVHPGDEDPWAVQIRGPEGGVVVTDRGPKRVPMSPENPEWLTDLSALMGLFTMQLGGFDDFAGRRVVRVTGRARPSLPNPAQAAGHILFGFQLGSTCELLIDADTGICLRFATFEGSRLVALRQFVEVELGGTIEDEVFIYRLAPGSRFLTDEDDVLDMLASGGVDVSGIDPTDVHAVYRARDEFYRRQQTQVGHFGGPVGPAPRALAETVAALGPPPVDTDEARLGIEQALLLLADDDEPRASCVERGEVLDRAAAGRPKPPPHPMVGDQQVTFVLIDLAFVSESEALVEFEIRLDRGMRFPVKGRAIQRGGTWFVSYDTWAHMQQLGGISVPSLLDHPENDA
jgi:hypothetical protein